MAGLFLVSTRDREFAESALAGARRQFALHGFSGLSEHAWPGWRLIHAPFILGGPESLLARGDDLVAVAGTLSCDGQFGQPALEALLAMADVPDWSRIGGQFVALVRAQGRTRLFTDFFGAFQLFHDAERRVFSTSLLSAVEALPNVSFDLQGVYEFAFNVVPVGDDTVFAELKMLGPDRVAELSPDGARLHDAAKPLPEATSEMPLLDRLAIHRDRLLSVVGPYAQAFEGRIFCPISGGLDSRLALAALKACGVMPSLYVYGGAESADVRIGREIAAGEGAAIEWLDKEGWREVAPDAFPDQVEANFHAYDGLPNYGELFENGANAFAREARHQDGALSVSGGCGEVYRNFFFLPDRPLSAAAVARTFFARYARSDVTAAFDERAFLRGIEDKILAALGRPGFRGKLPRALIEQVYPRVRCRALFGREISLEARYGPYLMPFLDHRVAAEAARLPLALKNAGRFEAALLNAISPRLASYPSAYGHDFTGPPGAAHRRAEFLTRIRPTMLRRYSYALRRRMGPVADEHGGLLSPDYMGRVVDLDFPAMRRFFRTGRIGDSGMMRRIANLEYLAAKLGSKLAP